MTSFARSALIAVLGPTNTGKTHLAIERMCGHSSGLMGFPLRLLAREVYDRVVAVKGRDQVALVTGEERIVPPGARYVLATAEAMPVRGGPGGLADYAFVAVDEVQLAADRERGHIFTDRLLHARGREETMLLGSASMRGMVSGLLPDAEIIARPRFSTLSYAGSRKLSRLPRRSAVVAFSVEEVYAVAELLRRHRGGAAVVMGSLSPAARNAQVAMFEAGEVDYLVATDAIGMGLNLNLDHVAFASLHKFDGQRIRRLTVAEMAQIAGRAGRHQKDGTFGDLASPDAPPAFSPEEIERIEQHRFDPVERVYWRRSDPPMESVAALIAGLVEKPGRPQLAAAPEALDLALLRHLSSMPDVAARVRGRAQVARLWAACSVPDFQKLGVEHHGRTVHRLWSYLSDGNALIPHDWFAGQLARLDNVQGDVDALAGRISAARLWAYVAQRSDWLHNPEEMAGRARALEERLSDALHAALRQRFVDRRTALLMRTVHHDNALLPVDVDGAGAVSVDGHVIGKLSGFRFLVDPAARASEKRLLIATAERRLGTHLKDKAEALIAAEDKVLSLAALPDEVPAILWDGVTIATLRQGKQLLSPEIQLDTGLAALPQDVQQGVRERLSRWLGAQCERHVPALMRMEAAARDPETPASVRAVIAQLVDAGGVVARRTLDDSLAAISKEDRAHLRKAGVFIGVLDLFHAGLIKPGGALWRMVLLSLRRGKPLVALPPAGAVLLPATGEGAWEDETGARIGGFRRIDDTYIRIDIAERLARAAHEAIAKNAPYAASDPMIISLGLAEPAFAELMRQAGFRPVADAAEGAANWAFRGRPRPRVPAQAQGAGARRVRTVSDENAARGEHPQRERAQKERPQRQRAPREQAGHPRNSAPAAASSARGQATSKALAGLGALLGREE